MVETLTPEEQRTAACTSYAYWYALTYFAEEDKPSLAVALQMAMKEARRHLVASLDDEELATEKLKSCCQFREVSYTTQCVWSKITSKETELTSIPST